MSVLETNFFSFPSNNQYSFQRFFFSSPQSVYALTIEAFDGAPSSLLGGSRGGPNVTPQTFRIAIADTNDNPPYFPQPVYRAEVPEDQVIEQILKWR